MDKWTHCLRAREDAEKINEMIAETNGDRELEFNNLHEAMVCAIYDMMLCKHEMHTADKEEWKDYNRQMYSAQYPQDSLSEAEANEWVSSIGQHWTMEQTTSEGKKIGVDFTKICERNWWATMNMIYSDFYKQGREVGVYAEWAYKFLHDKDGFPPEEKLYRFYKYVVKH